MLTKAPEFMKYIRASAGRAGLNVVWEDHNSPRHDGTTIYLPKVTIQTTEKDMKQLMSSVDHEVAHDKFSDFSILKANEPILADHPALMLVWNLLEDSRINNLEAQEFKGFRELWDETTPGLIPEIGVNFKSGEVDPVLAKIIPSMMEWESEISKKHFPNVASACKDHLKTDPEVSEMLKKYEKDLVECHGIKDKIVGSKSTFDLAKKILDVDNYDMPPSKRKKKGVGEGDEVADGSKGDKRDAKRHEEKEYKIVKIAMPKDGDKKLSITMPRKGGEKMCKVGINFDLDVGALKGSPHAWDVTNFELYDVADYPRNLGDREFFTTVHSKNFVREYELYVGSKIISQENFAQQVRRLIQIRAKVQTQFGVKRGKLDQSRISRVCFKAEGLSERIFKNKIKNTTLDSAVTILIDMSGSMGGTKVFNALGSALLMIEVCTTLNIPLEVLGFTDRSTGDHERGDAVPVMFIYKGFQDFKVAPADIKDYVAMSSSHMRGNPDGENILWAYDRLLQRKEKKRVLIVMSDGNPAATKSADGIIPFTKRVIEEIERKKKVSIYGLGLCSSAVTHLYQSHSVVNKPEDIPQKLLELFEKRIIGNE